MLNKAFPMFSKLANKREGAQQYQKLLNHFLADGVLDPLELDQLNYIEHKYDLTKEKTKDIQKNALSEYFKKIISDQRINEEERVSLQNLLNLFSLQSDEIGFEQDLFNKYYTLGLIEQGLLPTINNPDVISVIFQKEEILHYGAAGQLNKIKKITERINYKGITGSIKIMKGVRYRIGSIGVEKQTREILEAEDTGILYISNERIGFKGNRKQFSIPFNKILSFELFAEGLFIFKHGKETPYIVSLEEYELPLSVLSFLLNKE